jgi:hypothetical protein
MRKARHTLEGQPGRASFDCWQTDQAGELQDAINVSARIPQAKRMRRAAHSLLLLILRKEKTREQKQQQHNNITGCK